MYSDKNRVLTYLKTSVEEMDLVEKMSAEIKEPNDFGLSISGMTVFRACSMSLQYITENFVKIRNKVPDAFFANYKQVPWKAVFGMRNFLVHEYADVDDEAVFNTIKVDLPILRKTTEEIINALEAGVLDKFFDE